MTHPQVNPTALPLPVTSTDTGTHPRTPRHLCQEEIHSSKCQISSLLSSLSAFGGPRAPLVPPLAPPLPLRGCRRQSCEQQGARVELYTHVPAGPRVRADDRPTEGRRQRRALRSRERPPAVGTQLPPPVCSHQESHQPHQLLHLCLFVCLPMSCSIF